MRAIILAGGKGERLKPLTQKIAKALLPIHGKPAILQILENLRKVNIKDVIIVVGHLGQQIKDFLENYLPMNISYIKQPQPLGSAHALLQASPMIKGSILVSACDSLYPKNHYADLVQTFKRENLDAALSLKILNREKIVESSVVKWEKDGRISKIIEKPSKPEIFSNVSAGPLYVFKEVIKEYLPRVEKSKRGEYELPEVVGMMIADGLKVKGVMAKRWDHLSTMDDFLMLNFRYTKKII